MIYRNMNRKLIRLTEQDLHRIVKESVENILRESAPKPYQNYYADDSENGFDDYGNPMSNHEWWGEYGNGLKHRYDPSAKVLQTHMWSDSDEQFSRNNGNWARVYAKYGSTYDPSQGSMPNLDKKKEKLDADTRRGLKWSKENMRRALNAADKRPLHRKGSLNRAFD